MMGSLSNSAALKLCLLAAVCIAAGAHAVDRDTVAFSAYVNENGDRGIHAVAGDVINFGGVLTNAGGAYNADISAFVAPYAGPYFFSLGMDCSKDYRAAYVYVNNEYVFSGHNDGAWRLSGDDRKVTASAVLTLNAGDFVTVKHYAGDGHIDGGRESVFSGFLIK